MMSAQSRGIYHMQLKDDISAKPSWAPWRTLHSSSPWRTEWSWSSPSWAPLKRWSSSWTWTWLWSSSSGCIWTSQSAGSKIVFCGLRSAALGRMCNIWDQQKTAWGSASNHPSWACGQVRKSQKWNDKAFEEQVLWKIHMTCRSRWGQASTHRALEPK